MRHCTRIEAVWTVSEAPKRELDQLKSIRGSYIVPVGSFLILPLVESPFPQWMFPCPTLVESVVVAEIQGKVPKLFGYSKRISIEPRIEAV